MPGTICCRRRLRCVLLPHVCGVRLISCHLPVHRGLPRGRRHVRSSNCVRTEPQIHINHIKITYIFTARRRRGNGSSRAVGRPFWWDFILPISGHNLMLGLGWIASGSVGSSGHGSKFLATRSTKVQVSRCYWYYRKQAFSIA